MWDIVGSEQDFVMQRLTHTTMKSVFAARIFQPLEHPLTDENSFMATGNTYRDRSPRRLPRHDEHIIDDNTIAREPHDQPQQVEPPDEVESDSGSHAEEAEMDWQASMLFALDFQPRPMRVNWNDYETIHTEAASALGVTTHQLFALHHVSTPPQDLLDAGVEALLGHRHQDLPPGSPLQLILMDVEFHSALPDIQPEVVRRVVRLPRQIGRLAVLNRIGLGDFCRANHRDCIVWHNGNICSHTSACPFGLQHGHYIRIAVPPGDESVHHIATRCVASACHQGITNQELCDRHALYTLGWYDSIIGHPLVPLPLDIDEFSMLQTGIPTRSRESRPWFLHTSPVCSMDAWEHTGSITLPAGFEHMPKEPDDRPNDRLEDEPEYRRSAPPQFVRPIGHVANPLQGQPVAIQELFMLWMHLAQTQQGGPTTVITVETWYLSAPEHVDCRASRSVQLGNNFEMWTQQIIDEWLDVIDRDQWIHLHTVRPMPRVTITRPTVRPHVILTKQSPDNMVSNLYTVIDASGATMRPDQFAKFGPVLQSWQSTVQQCEAQDRCTQPHSAVQCMVWHGDHQLREPLAIPNRHGFEFMVIINPIQVHDPAHDPWHDDDEGMFLQTHASKTTLCLDELIPETVAVRLLCPDGTRLLPTPLEVDAPGTALQIQTELKHWGHYCEVIECVPHGIFLCIDSAKKADADGDIKFHYVFCHDDAQDTSGIICHSANHVLTEIEMMQFLCAIGYSRAVILDTVPINAEWIKVEFHHREPSLTCPMQQKKVRTPWPTRGHAARTSKRLFMFDVSAGSQSQCVLRTSFQSEDLHALFQSADGVLCTDFDAVELPPEVRCHLQTLPIRPITKTSDLDQYDRILIYTDGSSQPSMRRLPPQRADELGHPDTWSMLVIGETFHAEDSEVALLGWMAHPVRYSPGGAAYMCIDSIGSDQAERAALIGAGAWRLALNHRVHTVFCSDSLVGGQQACGNMGASQDEESFVLMRSIFQALETALGPQHLVVHHVTSHTGDCFNEFVDTVAKLEAKQTMNMQRQKIDMSKWSVHFRQLWVAFDSQYGMPTWTDGSLAVPAPDLPEIDDSSAPTTCRKGRRRNINFMLSMATANVNALYKGLDGHAGKLHYLQSQMREYKLNCIAVQEARTDHGLSCNGNILRFCTGHRDGQYGIELWFDLETPFAVDHRGKEYRFAASHFQVVHYDPQRLLVRCDADLLSFWVLACHAPHSGHPGAVRDAWWATTTHILEEYHDSDALFVLADANAEPGAFDGRTVLKKGFPSSANTQAFREILDMYELVLPATSDIHYGSNNTWTHCSGRTQHCIDHIAVPRTWLGRCTHSQVLEEYDLATMHDDHKPVALQMQWHECHAASTTQGRQRHGYKAARYQHHPEMRNQILGISELCWHNDVEQQTACITKHLHDVLGSTATPGSLCKKFYITEKAWQFRTDKIQYKKKIKETQRMLNRALLQCCFGAWTQHSQPRSEHVDLLEAFQYGISLRCTLLGLVARLRSAGLQLRQELTVNKKQALAACIAQLPPEASANDFLKQLKPFIGPTNPKKAKTKTMPVLNNEHGVRCQLPCEAQGIWIEAGYFPDPEHGGWSTHVSFSAQKNMDLRAPRVPTSNA